MGRIRTQFTIILVFYQIVVDLTNFPFYRFPTFLSKADPAPRQVYALPNALALLLATQLTTERRETFNFTARAHARTPKGPKPIIFQRRARNRRFVGVRTASPKPMGDGGPTLSRRFWGRPRAAGPPNIDDFQLDS